MKDLLSKIKLPDTSFAFSLNLTDVQKLIRDAGIVGGGAAIAYLISNLSSLNMGALTVVLVPVLSTVLNAVYKWFKDNSPEGK